MQINVSRREMMATTAGLSLIGLLGASTAHSANEPISLPAPRKTGGMPVMQALANRRSVREYAARELDAQTMSDLLWAAFGVNRPESGDRTAPSWRHSIETDIYVCTAAGVFAYEPKPHALRSVLATDIRAKSSAMVFVRTAPVVLIYTADLARMADAPREQQVPMAQVDSALIAQNVYLFSASAGLGTVVLGTVEREGLHKRLGLGEAQIVTFVQPVGYPK
jgi:nitroreductase